MHCFTLDVFKWMILSLTSYIGHLENIGLLSYADDPDIETFDYIVSNITFINITSSVIRKVFKYQQAIKFIVMHTSFPKL